jgi:hypothetical protein
MINIIILILILIIIFLIGNKSHFYVKKLNIKRCLFLDVLFPNNLAKWRLVEIYSFMNKYDTDILVKWGDNRYSIDYDALYKKFKLYNYNIIIFDDKFNYLNKYNNNFDGTKFNNKNNKFSFLFKLKKYKDSFYDLNYNFVYSLFTNPYKEFNKQFKFDYNNQFIHNYPFGSKVDGDINFNVDFNKSKYICTQYTIYDSLKKKNFKNIYKVYGGTLLFKNEKLIRKQNFNNTIYVCFTSVSENTYQKGLDIYVDIAKNNKNANIKFISVGNQPANKYIKHYKKMPQKKLKELYKNKVDVIINLSRNGDGFPLGTEGAIEGCILLTTDPYGANKKNNFNIDDFFIINKDINKILDKLNNIQSDLDFRKKMSYNIQDKMYELFNYNNQIEKIFNIIETNLNK